MSTDDVGATTANDLGGADDMLSPMEATDSDELRNSDGDEVVDPPESWSAADRYGVSSEEERLGETLDQRLAEEVPDVAPADIDPKPRERPYQ
ncbi:hypothetical protein ACNUDN_15870 [Mycobacterium sp. smrl_JER01]|uniref:hypothetical protein n=1 Tax=Mycobacterium sp. smrl_JER01 TaxID=3402633 RepID=UPI003AD68059